MPRSMLLLTMALGIVIVGLFTSALSCAQEVGWSAMKQTIRTTFPDVNHLSTDSLAAWMQDPQAPDVLLLDTRTVPEYAVSHLPGARRIDPDEPDFSILEGLPKDTPIVTYCSVGYRSSDIAEQLQERGWTNVYNLDGSIFQWANEGRPVYRDSTSVEAVHPYDSFWGRLLNPDLHAYEPD